MEVLKKVWRRFEKILAALLIGLSMIHAGQMMGAMATTSLSTDEFGTVNTFSSRGPLRVVTDYRAPKNHVFFNLLNSILPARDSLNPARVRILAILATTLTAGCVIAYATYRQRLMEGAIFLTLWSLAPQLLSLSMEARGYGFLAFFAVAGGICTIEFLRTRAHPWLWMLVATCVLGAYTIPAYLFFAAPLLLLLWAFDRTRVTFVAGLISAGGMLLLYAPLLTQLFAEFTEFQKAAESDFTSLHGILRAAKLYIFSAEDWETWTFLAAMAAAPLVLTWRFERGEREGFIVVAAACVAFLAILLVLKSPPIRVASFGFLPLTLAGLLSIGGFLRESLPFVVRPVVFTGLAIFLITDLLGAFKNFRFTPTEDWSLAGKALQHGFPENTKVDYLRYAKYIRHTLPDAESRSADFDESAFAAGDLVVVDAGNKWAEGRRFRPNPDLAKMAEWIVPGTIRDVVIHFKLPESQPELTSIPSKAADRNPHTGAALPPEGLEFSVTPPTGARSMVLFFNRPIVWRDVMVSAKAGDRDLAGDAIIAGNGVILPMHDVSGAVEFRLQPVSGDVDLREVWFVQ